ncbi:single-stranded-DNA-specific exonuclease RecJ [Candidatus Saccharibacteria bacterium]|nr:single-stranded-DNA-specific exonuclease RecJ [Candidatus Saccharibacteria bacterium]
MSLFHRILSARGISPETRATFLSPQYDKKHDPFLLPDMEKAVMRLEKARKNDEHITIYGDYDIDGLTATALLLDSFSGFGFTHVDAFIPNRFTEGYGLTVDAIERIAKTGASLVITVDCGSLSHVEIARANELGMDVIVTDHHNVSPEQPDAVAVINPKRLLQDHPDAYEKYLLKDQSNKLYPFLDLPGVGVAFKLVQALQARMSGIEPGQEKWLLDLVALGTVCDVVTLVDENRTHVFWGLKVLSKTRRPGLRALMTVAAVEPMAVNARSLGFGLGPRMNASGRLETAQYALDLLTTRDPQEALRIARQLDDMNKSRRKDQDGIFEEAKVQAEKYADDPVIVVSASGWNHGIVGIVAAKLLEKYQKPAFVLAEDGEVAKGSARSYGGFSAADAIRSAEAHITKGGGHALAAGVTLPVGAVDEFRKAVNNYYRELKLVDQAQLLVSTADADALLSEVDETLVGQFAALEPFGNGNPQPILRSVNLAVMDVRRMGDKAQHVKLLVRDTNDTQLQLLAFNAPDHFFVEVGERVDVWYSPDINEWQGRRSVEGRLLRVERR